MSDTTIEWTEKSWNPVRGCSNISPGCLHCYAARQAARFAAGRFRGFVRRMQSGDPQWTGKVAFLPDKLREPLSWKEPKEVFVNSMSDLFHEALPDDVADQIYAVMGNAPRHTFQVLTKRADRMQAFSEQNAPFGMNLRGQAFRLGLCDRLLYPLPNVWMGVSVEGPEWEWRIQELLRTHAAVRFLSLEPLLGEVNLPKWLGSRVPWSGEAPLDWSSKRIEWPEWVPAEARALIERTWSRAEGGRGPADYRVSGVGLAGSLTQAPGPLLGEHVRALHHGLGRAVRVGRSAPGRDPLGRWVYTGPEGRGWIVYPDGRVLRDVSTEGYVPPPRIDWVIVGGESGPKARDFDVAWARSAKHACENAGVAFFLKQVGKVALDPIPGEPRRRLHLVHAKGGDPTEWPEDLLLRQWPARHPRVAEAIRLREARP